MERHIVLIVIQVFIVLFRANQFVHYVGLEQQQMTLGQQFVVNAGQDH